MLVEFPSWGTTPQSAVASQNCPCPNDHRCSETHTTSTLIKVDNVTTSNTTVDLNRVTDQTANSLPHSCVTRCEKVSEKHGLDVESDENASQMSVEGKYNLI